MARRIEITLSEKDLSEVVKGLSDGADWQISLGQAWANCEGPESRNALAFAAGYRKLRDRLAGLL